ncbi:MAG: hypothetical protein RLN60_00105 [Phycisphaerales bacterium]
MRDRGGIAGLGEALVIEPEHLDRVLSGGLPCAVCKYELRGLSIRGVCPECGTPVRATILFRVDPRAKEFRPLTSRRFTSFGVVAWTVGALIACLGFWLVHVFGFLRAELDAPIRRDVAEYITLAGLGLSWFGSLALIRPVRGAPMAGTLQALFGVFGYAMLVASTLWLQAHDRASLIPYLDATPGLTRTTVRAVSGVSIVIILLGLRPHARMLVERCLVLRTGRVDRQTMLAMVVAVGVGLVGDALHMSAALASEGSTNAMTWAGTLLIALSGLFILAGLVHAQLDALHIRKSLLVPSPTLEELIAEEPPAPADPPA